MADDPRFDIVYNNDTVGVGRVLAAVGRARQARRRHRHDRARGTGGCPATSASSCRSTSRPTSSRRRAPRPRWRSPAAPDDPEPFAAGAARAERRAPALGDAGRAAAGHPRRGRHLDHDAGAARPLGRRAHTAARGRAARHTRGLGRRRGQGLGHRRSPTTRGTTRRRRRRRAAVLATRRHERRDAAVDRDLRGRTEPVRPPRRSGRPAQAGRRSHRRASTPDAAVLHRRRLVVDARQRSARLGPQPARAAGAGGRLRLAHLTRGTRRRRHARRSAARPGCGRPRGCRARSRPRRCTSTTSTRSTPPPTPRSPRSWPPPVAEASAALHRRRLDAVPLVAARQRARRADHRRADRRRRSTAERGRSRRRSASTSTT